MTTENLKHNPEDVFLFIVSYKKRHDGISPTVREISDECNIPSTSHVNRILSKLQDAGRIEMATGGKSRAIQVVGARWIPPRSAQKGL
jgi:SOS-response transcriptional repressor LexA